MEPVLASVGGWWWPAADVRARPVLERDARDAIPAILKNIRGRDCVVQAGANVGLFPITLADHFQKVVTAEPDHANWLCLKRNIEARDSLKRVSAWHCAFGAEAGHCGVEAVEPDNCGAHRIVLGGGYTPVMRIDDLGLAACDAILLDVEGHELPALQGAVETVAQFSPVIVLEDKGHHRAFGIPDGALQSWLAERQYVQVDKIANDKVFVRSSPLAVAA